MQDREERAPKDFTNHELIILERAGRRINRLASVRDEVYARLIDERSAKFVEREIDFAKIRELSETLASLQKNVDLEIEHRSELLYSFKNPDFCASNHNLFGLPRAKDFDSEHVEAVASTFRANSQS